MTVHNALFTGGSVVQAVDARQSLAGWLAVDGSAPGVRQGVLWAPGSPLAVSGTSSTSPWQYSVAAGMAVVSKGALDGARVVANDAPVLVSTVAPPASNSRYDVIYIMQQDSAATISPDGTTAPLIGVVNGTSGAAPTVPSTPVGSLILAVARVFSTATAGTSGANVTLTTSGQVPGGTAWIAQYTAARGAAIPVRSAAEEGAITGGNASMLYRLDTSKLRVWNGTSYVSSAVPVSVAGGAATSLPTGTDYGVGPITVTEGGTVATGSTDTITWQASGFVMIDALFYVPTTANKYAWINVPGTSKRFQSAPFPTYDRVSLSGISRVSAGDAWSFGDRQESGGAISTTLTISGLFIPS